MQTGITSSSRGHVGIIEIQRPPHNFFDAALLEDIAIALESFEADANCRATVLCAQGTAFCAGADFSADVELPAEGIHPMYRMALRIFACSKPIVGAVHGAAIGGGLGLALACDFRVTCAEARFSANFARLGTHPGFGLSVTLPRLVGAQWAATLFYTGRRVDGEEAVRRGLADMLTPQAEVRSSAILLAEEIAASAPLALLATRATLRASLRDEVEAAITRESAAQKKLFSTSDFREGVAAMAARRAPVFTGA